MGSALSLFEGVVVYIVETFTAGVIQSCQGQEQHNVSLLQDQNPLEDFRTFDRNDEIFQEYDPPPGDDSKMGWKRSRPTRLMSLWKAMNCAFCIQILGGVALGSLAILILIINFNTVDLCYDLQRSNWTSLPKRYQLIILTVATSEAYVIQLWTFLVVLTMFDWSLIKKLNLLTLNLLCAFLDTCYRLYLQVYGVYRSPWMPYPLNGLFVFMLVMNGFLIGREIANNSETERKARMKKAIKVSVILFSQFAFGLPIALSVVRGLIPLYGKASETDRTIIAGALPLVTAIPKVIVRLAAQRIGFLHPGDAHVLLIVLFSVSAIVFRVMQAELKTIKLYIILSFAHGAIDLLERLTIVIRDYVWYFIYKKLKRDKRETILKANQFRSPRSMRFVADMSIQMILGESTSLIAAVGVIQLYNFLYKGKDTSSEITEFFKRVSIALSIDFAFNSLSFWLQMSYMNVAVVRVWRKKWRKHMFIAFILITVTMFYFSGDFFVLVRAKNGSKATNCTEPFSKF